jgi:hypothetical protein
LSEPRKPLRIALFILMVIAVGWLDLFFFDRAVPLQFLWFVLSGAAVIAAWHFLTRCPQ